MWTQAGPLCQVHVVQVESMLYKVECKLTPNEKKCHSQITPTPTVASYKVCVSHFEETQAYKKMQSLLFCF